LTYTVPEESLEGFMKEFVEFIARHLVDNPDRIILEREEKDDKIVFRLTVAEADIGKVIGRQGRTAQAIRVLLAAVAAREGKRALLEIVD
jgi:predicted RNA-binding protein YlqC (UPF0109 family)